MGSAIVEPDDALARMVLDVLRSRFEAEERSGTHVSDLLWPRQAWFAKRCPAIRLTDDECLYFIAGRAHHAIVESLIASEEAREVSIEWNGIQGTVDSIAGNPIEFKTTRSQKQWDASEVPGHYILQLGMYCAMLSPEKGEGVGSLLILYLSTKREGWRRRRFVPKLVSFTIRYTDLQGVRDLMLARKAMLEGSEVPPTDICEPWLCRSCRFRNKECEGRSDAWR